MLGLALAAQLQWPESRAAHHVCTAGALLTLGVAGLAGLQSMSGLGLPWDRWFLIQPATVGEIPVGRMSPMTALAFGLTAYALLVQSTRFTVVRNIRRSASVATAAGRPAFSNALRRCSRMCPPCSPPRTIPRRAAG